MTDRFPLIANPTTKQIQELASGDNLNLQNSGIVGATTITADKFVGPLEGNATSADTLNFAGNIISGTISSSRLSGNYGINVTSADTLNNAANITTGTISSSRLSGTYGINVTGTATTAINLANAANITTGTINPDRLTGNYDINVSSASTAFDLTPGVYSVDISGNAATATTAINLTNAANIITGFISSERLSGPYDISATNAITAINLTDAANINTGTISSARLSGTYAINVTGTATTAINLANAANITTGTINPDRLTGNYGINILGNATTASVATTAINLANAANITTGTISSSRLSGTYAINVTGTATTAINLADAANITTGTISSSRLSGTYGINVTGTANTASVATTAINLADAANITTGFISSERLSGFYGINVSTATTAINLSDAANITTGTISSSRLSGTYGINVSTATTAINVIGGIASVTNLRATGITTLGVTTVRELKSTGIVTASSYIGDGSTLSNIVTKVTAGIGISLRPPIGTGIVRIESYSPTGKTIFVSQNGNDSNTGLAENYPKKTIKSAASIAFTGDTIKVFPGTYVEDNPIVLRKTVSVEGTELRNCVVTPRDLSRDLFHVNNGCHITDLSFIGGDMTDGAAVVALQPLEGVSVDRYFDAARLIRFNLDYIANETVGFLTSGFSGFAGNHREQDAARLIDSNLNYIAAEAVGFLTSPVGYGFTLNVSNNTNCKEDIVSIFSAVSYDLKANSNKKSVGAGFSYFNSSGGLIHITGIATQQATIAALNYAAGIATYVINNFTPPISYQSIGSSISQYKNPSVIAVAGGCVGVGTTIRQLVGIVTSMIGAGSTFVAPAIRYGVNLESADCADDIKDIWKCIIHDITRGGNSKCVSAGEAYYDDNWNLIPQILKNPGEVSQTISSIDYSFNVARSVVNNCTWGGYPVGLGTSVSNALYDYKTGITTITASQHGLIKDDAVKITGLQYECNNGSPAEPIGVSTAVYNNITGITTITTSTSHKLSSGMQVRLNGLVFNCNSGGGLSTAIYPSGNNGYDFTVQDILTPFKYTVNVGVSTLSHSYVNGGTSTRLYTPRLGVSTAVYNNITGITTITLNASDNKKVYIESGQKIKLENLIFNCNSGGGFSTAFYPSGNLGYSFEVISTNNDRYVDASNLIKSNRIEIIDKSLASIAIAHSDFYFPVGVQTTRYSRFKDSYRLIQQNRQEIVDTAWTNTLGSYPGITSTQTKCKRDLGYFVDAVSTDLFTGGNSYVIDFIDQYFDANGNPISNGLVGEEVPSIFAFNKARDLMKSAITNQLTIKDLTLTPDPLTNNVNSVNSCADVQSTIATLTEIATTAIDNGNLDFIDGIFRNTGIFVLGENICRRDIGFVVDALIEDVKHGTNKHIREATRAYFDANGNPISNGLVGEEAPSITAFNSIGNYAKKAMRNLLNVKDLTITADPLTGNNQSETSCADVATNIDNLISILTTTITNGNLSSYPALYISNNVKVNVGVSTIAHTYVSGGTVVSNYTTNTFPDGTYNFIFPVYNVINSNTFEFVGGKTNLPHTYVSGGSVQKYSNFQNTYTQVKDLGIQVDPKTGFNNSINSCSNVISALHSCVGIITTIVGLGSESNINTTYPGNSGTGISNYYNVYDAIYDETIGIATITSPGIRVDVGDFVEIRDLIFECSSNGSPSTQKFPSGNYGYDFQVMKVNGSGNFEINVGVSSLPHTYISGGVAINRTLNVYSAYYNNVTGITTITVPGISIETGDLVEVKNLEFSCGSGAGTTTIYPTGSDGYKFRVLNIITDKVFNVSNASYNNISGIATITAPGFVINHGDLVELRNLEFSCPDSPPNLTYPSGNNGYKFEVKYVNSDNTFVVNVGPSTIPHTYVSGGTVVNRTLTANDTFTIQVGTSTIPHTYVSGGTVSPPYSPGVGPITQGPYVRNCTNFIPKSIGMKVDGFAAEPGDKDDIGVTGTMSVDSYTQFNQGGIGVSITNGAYTQLVSIFTICNDIAIFTSSGGQCDITNSNCSFGRLGLYSDGVGDSSTNSLYRYTGNVKTNAEAEQSIIEISNIGNLRPYDGQTLYFGELFYTIKSVEVTNGGFGYTQAPLVTIDLPTGENGIRAEASANINDFGQLVSIDLISNGSQYRLSDSPSITIEGPSGVGVTATAQLTFDPIYYTIESATLPSAGISTVTLNNNLNSSVSVGTTAYFSRLSLQIATSISLEWVGSGTDIKKAKPALGGVVVQENEVVKKNGGEIVYTSTDQAGNFRIGDGVVVNQLTGTISGRSFSQSLLNTVTPLIIALGN